MARPARTNAEYFPHSANFRNDRRIKSIRARFGPAGYGLVVMMMEALTDAPNLQLATDEIELELLAGDLGVSVTEIDSLLQVAEKIGLFARTAEGNLTCPDLNKSLEPIFEKRNRARAAFQNNKDDVDSTETTSKPGVSVTETTQSKVEESKVKESNKEIESSASEAAPPAPSPSGESSPKQQRGATQKPKTDPKPKFVPPTLNEVIAYMATKKHHPETAEAFVDYFTSNGWKVGGRAPMKDWQSAARRWMNYEEERNGPPKPRATAAQPIPHTTYQDLLKPEYRYGA